MRHYRIESTYRHKNPDMLRRVRECIRRRSVLGPWKKVCLERIRHQELKEANSPKKNAQQEQVEEKVDEDTTVAAADAAPALPAVNPLLAQKEAEYRALEIQLQELLDKKHIQFGLLRTILMDEARAKSKPPAASAVPGALPPPGAAPSG
ncbi:Aste57867_14567 [Aphanomyces stellatus]|uniref:Aste57867_14567 protein n=1 Tax=Aphanomyces stellatus TaxID=120398 RepID=A0A485L1T8_9STRA|nr:hypothetical protein As57867_014513 [Aphanomyces stellatus]VFT91387.1 Aste57867_14567 [Aphanomyces stellatus]